MQVRGLTGIWGFTILSSYNEGYMKGGRERGRGRNISIIFITYKIPFDPENGISRQSIYTIVSQALICTRKISSKKQKMDKQ